MDDPWIRSFSTRVNLRQWERYRHTNNIPVPERLCARIVFPHALDWLYRPESGVFVDVLDAFFDRNEPFMHHVRADWMSSNVRKEFPFWSLVRTIETTAAHLTPALQIADMICWGYHRQGTYEKEKPWEYDHAGYTAAVRCANVLRGIYVEITEGFLQRARILEEGQARFELWNKRTQVVLNPSVEYKQFDAMMKRFKLYEEKAQQRPNRKTKKAAPSGQEPRGTG